MHVPSLLEVKQLMEGHPGPCISLFMPTYRTGEESQQNHIRLKNLIREAENLVHPHEHIPVRKDELLKPVCALLENGQLWSHPADGLAIFRSPDVLRYYQLPGQVKEQVITSDHFYLKPLLPYLTNDGRFYILAISQNGIRLLESTRYSVHEVELPEAVPENLAATLRSDHLIDRLQYHSSGSSAAVGKGGRHAVIFHGQGSLDDESKEQIVRYFRQIDKGLHEILHNEHVPMILAGVEYLFPLYEEVNSYPHFLNHALFGNPDRLDIETLRQQAWPLVEPYLLRTRQEAIDYYERCAGTERVSSNISVIVPAAYYGRVAKLFITTDRTIWGKFDPLRNAITVHQIAMPGDDDLVECASTQTLLHSGAVYTVDPVPGGDVAAAVFRYE